MPELLAAAMVICRGHRWGLVVEQEEQGAVVGVVEARVVVLEVLGAAEIR